MPQIPITVEASCANHPRLIPGTPLPRQAHTRISLKRLFSLGTLREQDVSTDGRRNYVETRQLWSALHQLYSVYLQFSPQQLTTNANGETLMKLSEVVGIALGVAAMCAQFDININRFRRYQVVGTRTRHVDFEYYSGNQRFFHEAKGTTYVQRVARLRSDILDQKTQTRSHIAAQANAIAITACTGSIAQYRHTSRLNFPSQIILVDPPPSDQVEARAAAEADELACVVRYYQNLYSITHRRPQGRKQVGLDEWLMTVARGLESGEAAPRSAPENLISRGRLIEPGSSDSLYRGTLFDARIARRSVKTYDSFESATESIPNPVTFLGVSEEITELIRNCRWTDLLGYKNRVLDAVGESDGIDISESGVLTKRLDTAEFNDSSKREFLLLKKRLI